MISVAMAVYNGEKHLKEQVDSILRQTISDIELVITDDCSTDGSWELMQQLAANDKRVRVFHNEKNLGFLRNFEKAISLCKGEYVALSDDDDIWYPDHLEKLMNALGDKVLVCGNSDFIDAEGNSLGTTLKYQESFDWVPNSDTRKFLSIMLFRNPYQGATMFMRRSLIEKALPIPETMRYHDTWLASMACFCGGINYVDTPLMKYRRTETSITGMRQKRKSKLYRFLFLNFDSDRLDIVDAIRSRMEDSLTRKQKKALSDVESVINHFNKKHNSMYVHLYEFFHYKTIYSCNLTHWI